MSASEYSDLLEPISAEAPCGASIEDTQLLASFDAYRLFGQSTPLEQGDKKIDWREIKSASRDALKGCKDFRLLGHLAAAVARLEGIASYCSVLEVAAQWLESYWDSVHPQLDDDAIMRKNALNSLADRMAVVDALRRASLATNPQLGSCSFRDVEIAAAQLTLPEGESPAVTETQINAVLTAASSEHLAALHAGLQAGSAAVKRIDAKMRNEGGSEAAPSFDELQSLLVKMARVLEPYLIAESSAGESASPGTGEAPQSGAVRAVGAIASRQDAIRALDAVAAFFRQNEPSSPVPLFVERAKRMVAMDFLELLADIAPDAVGQAKAAGGIRDDA